MTLGGHKKTHRWKEKNIKIKCFERHISASILRNRCSVIDVTFCSRALITRAQTLPHMCVLKPLSLSVVLYLMETKLIVPMRKTSLKKTSYGVIYM